MGKILCATRGGEASYRTQDRVIQMAKDEGSDLIFVFALDTRFLDKTAAPILVDVEPEIQNMAEFLLLMAQERAAKGGVKADMIVKEGALRDVLLETAAEQDATCIVLGSPAEQSRFELGNIQKFAADLEESSGIDVRIV